MLVEGKKKEKGSENVKIASYQLKVQEKEVSEARKSFRELRKYSKGATHMTREIK